MFITIKFELLTLMAKVLIIAMLMVEIMDQLFQHQQIYLLEMVYIETK
jgi:hypothetical protein